MHAAKYEDVQLKSGNKEWTDEQMERLIDKVMVLFKFIKGVCVCVCVCDCGDVQSLSLSLSLSLSPRQRCV